MPSQEQAVISYKVAVVLPSAEKDELSKIVNWAQENIKAAQEGQESRIQLDLEWIDEEGAGMAKEVSRIAHDNSYAAIIGPRYSRNARIIARESLSYRIPVLMPSVTSTEFQRIYAGSNMTEANLFCLAENDMSQCMAMLSKARANNYGRIGRRRGECRHGPGGHSGFDFRRKGRHAHLQLDGCRLRATVKAMSCTATKPTAITGHLRSTLINSPTMCFLIRAVSTGHMRITISSGQVSASFERLSRIHWGAKR